MCNFLDVIINDRELKWRDKIWRKLELKLYHEHSGAKWVIIFFMARM